MTYINNADYVGQLDQPSNDELLGAYDEYISSIPAQDSDLALNGSSEPLVTNTDLHSPYDPLNPLEAKYYGAFKGFENRKKRYILQNVQKTLLGAKSPAIYIPVDTIGTHVKRGSKYIPVSTDEKATHYFCKDSAGFDRYVSVSARKRGIRYGKHLLDENGEGRRANSFEHPTHFKLQPLFYRCGACQQLSQSFRPATIQGEFSGDDHLYISENVSVADVKLRHKPDVDGEKSRLFDGAITGMVHCDAVHNCPYCQPIISEQRALEVNTGIYNHYKNGGYIAFVTWTCRHEKGFSLEKTLEGLTKAITRVKQGKRWQGFKERNGWIGQVRSLEHTYTESGGHHPHVHEIFFLSEKPDIKAMKKELFEPYYKIFKKMKGFRVPDYKYGLDIRLEASEQQLREEVINSDDDFDLEKLTKLAEYCTKGIDVDAEISEAVSSGWHLGQEMTKSGAKSPITKKDGSISYSPVGLMYKAYFADKILSAGSNLSDGDRIKYQNQRSRFKALFREYCVRFRGRSQCRWSDGLRESLKVGETMLANEIIKVRDDSFDIPVTHLTVDQLAIIAKFKLRSRVEHMAQESFAFCKDVERVKVDVLAFIDSFEGASNRYYSDSYGDHV